MLFIFPLCTLPFRNVLIQRQMYLVSGLVVASLYSAAGPETRQLGNAVCIHRGCLASLASLPPSFIPASASDFNGDIPRYSTISRYCSKTSKIISSLHYDFHRRNAVGLVTTGALRISSMGESSIHCARPPPTPACTAIYCNRTFCPCCGCLFECNILEAFL